MKLLRLVLKIASVLTVTWVLVWTWFWSGWDMLVFDLYSIYAYDGRDPESMYNASFDTAIVASILLSCLLVRGAMRLFESGRNRSKPAEGRPSFMTRCLDAMSQFAVVFILAWPVATAWNLWDGEGLYFRLCPNCYAGYDYAMLGVSLLLPSLLVAGLGRVWRMWLKRPATTKAA